MTNNILQAQVHIWTTQQVFSSLSDPKKQTFCISKTIFFENQHTFQKQARKVPPAKWQNSFFYCAT